MRPTNPKPITPMPTRSLAPMTRFQEAAVKAAAAVPLLIKLRRVNSGRGFDWDECKGWVIIQESGRDGLAFPGHDRTLNEQNRFSRLSRKSRLASAS